MADKPPPPQRSRPKGATARLLMELIKSGKEEDACKLLQNNPKLELSIPDIVRALDGLPDKENEASNNQTETTQMYCKILMVLFLNRMQMSQYSADDSLKMIGKYLKKLNISKYEFIMFTAIDLIKKSNVLTNFIVDNGIYKVFNIDEKSLSQEQISNIFNLLLGIAIEIKSEKLLDMMARNNTNLSAQENNLLTEKRAQLAYEFSNVTRLKQLYADNPAVFEGLAHRLNMSDFDADFLTTSLNSEFTDKLAMIKCYSAITTNATYDDMLLTCAALKSKKPWFNTIVLNGDENLDDLRELCEFIRQHESLFIDKPVSFIMSGTHWINGVILVTSTGVEVLLIDPLGKQSIDEGANFPKKKDRTPYKIDELINMIFPEAKIIIPENKTQHADHACWVFALDAVRKLQRIAHLPSRLPLSILRNTQSLTTIKGYVESGKYDKWLNNPVNKKKLTFESSVNQHIGVDSIEKNVNKRIEHKFLQLKQKVWEYIKTHSEEDIVGGMQNFTLNAFKDRMCSEQRKESPM